MPGTYEERIGRNGAAYANVHTAKIPSGEIRGALGKAHDHGSGDDDNDD